MRSGFGPRQIPMPTHQHHQGTPDVFRKQRHGDDRNDSPHEQRMPLPLPDIPKEAPGMMAEVFDLAPRERETPGVKDMDTQLNERDEQNQMKRGYHMGSELRGDVIEAESPGEKNHQQRSDSY